MPKFTVVAPVMFRPALLVPEATPEAIVTPEPILTVPLVKDNRPLPVVRIMDEAPPKVRFDPAAIDEAAVNVVFKSNVKDSLPVMLMGAVVPKVKVSVERESLMETFPLLEPSTI